MAAPLGASPKQSVPTIAVQQGMVIRVKDTSTPVLLRVHDDP
jgi:hypothetical protein